ncbi:MAG: hypothetical protein K1X47_01280 [Cyclobacteriaceae bacterium]|nr:hypothetical protein [Cyclobacteriaceae bacterium]
MTRSGSIFLVIVLIFTFPIWIGIAGGMIGLVAGLLGALIGVAAGLFGAVMGVIGAILHGLFHPFQGWGFPFGAILMACFVVALIIALSAKARKR